MANYQELLSKAVNALPDNSGAARRAVYEKARKALVTQLRAISPPLPAREITRHRLELEDCIRQVEYEATEELLGSLKGLDEETIAMQAEVVPEAEPEPVPELEGEQTPAPAQPGGIDAIIARAEKAQSERPASAPVSPVPQNIPASDVADDGDDADDAAAEAEAEAGAVEKTREVEPSAKTSVSALEHQLESSMVSGPQNPSPDDFDDQQSGNKQPDADDLKDQEDDEREEEELSVLGPVTREAMSRVREVELEGPARQKPSLPQTRKTKNDGQQDVAQKVVDRAIEVLDREARGEHVPIEEISLNEDQFGGKGASADLDETGFAAGGDEEKGGNALTIFLVLAIVLLGIVGGGGYWAWREGYVDLDALFATSAPALPGDGVSDNASKPNPQGKLPEGGAAGPGNTATDNNIAAPSENLVSSESAGKGQEQLSPSSDNAASGDAPKPEMTTTQTPTPEAATPVATADGVRTIEPTPGPNAVTDTNKSEERLTTAPIANEPTLATNEANNNDTVATGTQSLLLEASADGTTGAVPFSGTVEWSRGVDELGQPTLIGTANIPARNLGVKVLIRRNADPTLPASHLMEIDFTVTPTFAGGSVAGLPGILLKNEELVQGTALIGASARVVGNSFLFALSAAPQDVRTNINLLKTQKWMDLAIIYATGRRAIITLEKDAAAQKMFDDVLAAWQSEAEAEAAKANTNGTNG